MGTNCARSTQLDVHVLLVHGRACPKRVSCLLSFGVLLMQAKGILRVACTELYKCCVGGGSRGSIRVCDLPPESADSYQVQMRGGICNQHGAYGGWGKGLLMLTINAQRSSSTSPLWPDLFSNAVTMSRSLRCRSMCHIHVRSQRWLCITKASWLCQLTPMVAGCCTRWSPCKCISKP